jgi:hypothetical protein
MSVASSVVAHLTGEYDEDSDYDEDIDEDLQRYMYDPNRPNDYKYDEDDVEEQQEEPQAKKSFKKKKKQVFKKEITYVYVSDDEKEHEEQVPSMIQAVSFQINAVECFKMNWGLAFPDQTLSKTINLKRIGMASCVINGKLYMHGGRDGKYTYSDLYSYDWEKNEWKNELPFNLKGGPRMSDHMILPLFGSYDFAFYNYGHDVTILQNGFDPAENKQRRWIECYSQDQYNSNIIPVHFSSLCSVQGVIYVFGGRNLQSGNCMNQFYTVSVGKQHNSYYCNRKLIEPANKYQFVPEARGEHSVAAVGDIMYIFGGVGRGSKLLNDLCCYDTKKGVWHQIDISGSIRPPPLFAHSMTFDNTNHHLFLYGGITTDKKISNAIYRFDPDKKEWSLNLVRGPNPSGTVPSPTTHQYPLAYHTMNAAGNNIIMVGGMINYETREPLANALILQSSNDSGAEVSQWHYLQEGLKQEIMCDIALRVVSDDEQGHEYIKAHKCILACRCPEFFSDEKLSNAVVMSTCDLPMIDVLQNFRVRTVRALIEFLYTGNLKLTGGSKYIEELIELSRTVLDHENYVLMRQIVLESHRAHLETTRKVIMRLENDMERMYNQCVENVRYDTETESTNPMHADVRIQLEDSNDGSIFFSC